MLAAQASPRREPVPALRTDVVLAPLAVARDLASVAVQVIYDRVAPSMSFLGVASSRLGAERSAAALAYLSTVPFPTIPIWERSIG